MASGYFHTKDCAIRSSKNNHNVPRYIVTVAQSEDWRPYCDETISYKAYESLKYCAKRVLEMHSWYNFLWATIEDMDGNVLWESE